MADDIRILILEDSTTDADLMLRALGRSAHGPNVAIVATEQSFTRALAEFQPDLILADFRLPSFDGFEALVLARRERPEIPFIFVSGAMGDDLAVETLKRGATDLVLKSNLARLAAVVERALKEKETSARREAAEAALKAHEEFLDAVINAAGDPVFVKDSEHRYVLVNDAYCRFAGATREQLLGRTGLESCSRDQRRANWEQDELVLRSGQALSKDIRINCATGAAHTISIVKNLYTDRSGRRFIVGAFKDITAHKKLEQHLREVAELKSGMISLVSHEFGNILTSMNAAMHLLEGSEPVPKDESRRHSYEVVRRSIERLKGTSLNFLNLHRLESGKLPLDLHATPIRSVVLDRVLALRPMAEVRRIELRLESDLPEDLQLQVRADPEALSLVVGNLISNAVKYTPAGGSVTIRLGLPEGDPSRALLEVRDTGIGIEPRERALISSGFYRTARGRRVAGGFGVGLMLVKELLERHGSHLEIRSKPGQGSCFSFSLPCEAADVRPVRRA
ncbi:MAG: PAS domain S-box protein [Elusimicrobia bacterium]|nr:PAS domain S-box protein [Elusimicrobiota bacterium]